jgi:hypothetical protein
VIVNTTRINVCPENRKELFQTIWPLLDPIRKERDAWVIAAMWIDGRKLGHPR